MGWGRSQGVELTQWALTTTLSNVQSRDFKHVLSEPTSTVSMQKIYIYRLGLVLQYKK